RRRTESCLPRETLKLRNSQENRTCIVSELYCKADPVCEEAWTYHRQLCEQVFLGNKECNTRCKNSMNILLQRWNVNIKECECEGGNYERCISEKRQILPSCYGIEYFHGRDSSSGGEGSRSINEHFFSSKW